MNNDNRNINTATPNNLPTVGEYFEGVNTPVVTLLNENDGEVIGYKSDYIAESAGLNLKLCGGCGASFAPGVVTCSRCGSKLYTVSAFGYSNRKQLADVSPKKTLEKLLVVLVVVLAITATVLTVLLVKRLGSDEDNVKKAVNDVSAELVSEEESSEFAYLEDSKSFDYGDVRDEGEWPLFHGKGEEGKHGRG